MSIKKYLLTYVAFLLSIGLFFVGFRYFYSCFSLFGTELFTTDTYAETTACANTYQDMLYNSLSSLPSLENMEYEEGADGPIYYNLPANHQGLELYICFFHQDGSSTTYTSCSIEDYHAIRNQNPDQLPFSYFYGTDRQVSTNIPRLSGYKIFPSLFYETEYEDPSAPYALQSWVSEPEQNQSFSQQMNLYAGFQYAQWNPLGIPLIPYLCFSLGAIIVFAILILKEEISRLACGKKGLVSLFPGFYFLEMNLAVSFLGAAIALFTIVSRQDSFWLWARAFLWTVLSLLFLFRFLAWLFYWKQKKELSGHLFCLCLIRYFPRIWPFIALFFLVLLINSREDLFYASGISWFPRLIYSFLFLGFLCFLFLLFQIRDKIKAISKGEAKKTDAKLPKPFSTIEQELSQIQEVFLKAAEESIQNERLKAELITNISHDLKTPLTSIINYVRLLKKTSVSDPKSEEYLNVLEEKSLKLQSLTEDLLDLSRLSSGNEAVSLKPLDFSEIVRQANGEFAEKFEEKGLELKSSLPKEPAWAMADGRKMWRVMENLYGNTVKYAMEHTRVYVTVEEGKKEFLFTIRNISKQELNISPKELKERFVKGDPSRHTEGNGLGLSIVETLIQIQGGQFALDIQGDLFTARFTVPKADGKEMPCS